MTTGGNVNNTAPLAQLSGLMFQLFQIIYVTTAIWSTKIINQFIGVHKVLLSQLIGLKNDKNVLADTNIVANPIQDFTYRSNYRFQSIKPSVIFDTINLEMAVTFGA